MRFSVLANAAFASSALAIPSSLNSAIAPRQEGACLTRAEAKEIVDIYVQLIANYTDEVCAKYCASDFVDRSDSINTFIFTPLGQPTFATKEIFMAAQNANPPFPVVVDSIDAVDCEAVALRWPRLALPTSLARASPSSAPPSVRDMRRSRASMSSSTA